MLTILFELFWESFTKYSTPLIYCSKKIWAPCKGKRFSEIFPFCDDIFAEFPLTMRTLCQQLRNYADTDSEYIFLKKLKDQKQIVNEWTNLDVLSLTLLCTVHIDEVTSKLRGAWLIIFFFKLWKSVYAYFLYFVRVWSRINCVILFLEAWREEE